MCHKEVKLIADKYPQLADAITHGNLTEGSREFELVEEQYSEPAKIPEQPDLAAE